MKNIKLKELTISNWKGINAHHVFGDNENRISGRNRSGKTTIMRAWSWLLTGYSDANTPQNSDLFDNREEITKDTPTASVKAVVDIDGEQYTVERTATASFSRKRGTDEFVKNPSDNYKYFVDEIERNATDFKEWLATMFSDVDLLRFSMDGQFFVNAVFADKKKARAIIENIIGEVKREEMKGDYSLIDELLLKYSLDEIDAKATNMAKGINQRLTEIPSLIKNMESEVSEIEQTDFVAIDKEIADLEQERESLDKRLLDLTERVKPQMEAKYKAESQREMKMELYKKELNNWLHEADSEKERLVGEINAIRKQNEESKRKHEEAESRKERYIKERDNAINALKNAELKRERLLKERDAEKSKTFDPAGAICPNCGAQLTGDKLKEVAERFEKVQREKINSIVTEGKANNVEIERLTKIIENAQPYIDAAIPEVLNQSTADLEAAVLRLTNNQRTEAEFKSTERGKTLLSDIETVVIQEVKMPDDTEIKEAKSVINEKLVPLYEKRGLKSRAESLKSNIETLHSEQKEKGADLAKYERIRQLVKDYKQEQMEILSHKVNDGLKFSRIECWSQQKDGTIVPDLVIKDSLGVNFATTNNASRIMTTVDVQRFFCDKLGVNMPTWIDECSIVDPENMPKLENVQMFCLFRADTALKVESK